MTLSKPSRTLKAASEASASSPRLRAITALVSRVLQPGVALLLVAIAAVVVAAALARPLNPSDFDPALLEAVDADALIQDAGNVVPIGGPVLVPQAALFWLGGSLLAGGVVLLVLSRRPGASVGSLRLGGVGACVAASLVTALVGTPPDPVSTVLAFVTFSVVSSAAYGLLLLAVTSLFRAEA